MLGLVVNGPIFTFDSYGYIQYADLILGQSAWLHGANLEFNLSVAPKFRPDVDLSVITLTRLIGYPALIALLKLLCGEWFATALVVVQCLASAFVMFYAWKTSSSFGLGAKPVILIAIVLYGLSHSFYWDLAIMTDSLFSNILLMLILSTTKLLISGSVVTAKYGLVFSFSSILLILLRDVSYPVVILIAAIVFLHHLAMGRFKVAILGSVLLLMPVHMATTAYGHWNQYRTGYRFSTLLPYTLMRPIVAAHLYGHDVIVSSSPMHAAIVKVRQTPHLGDICATRRTHVLRSALLNEDNHGRASECADFVHRALMEQLRSSPMLARLATNEFIAFSLSRPDLLLRYISEELLPINIIDIVSSNALLSVFVSRGVLNHGTIAYRDALRNMASLELADVVLVLGDLLSKLVSLCIGIAFVVGLVLAARLRIRGVTFAAFLHLSVVLALNLGHAIVHLEPRYVMAAHFLVLMDGAFAFATYRQARRRL